MEYIDDPVHQISISTYIVFSVMPVCVCVLWVPNEVTTEHGLDVVHFDFVGGDVLKNQIVINQVKNLIFTGMFE